MTDHPHEVLVLAGPTASGKAQAAYHLAESQSLQIVSMDSMKVYRAMDVGTAKAPAAWRDRVPTHMVNVADPHEEFDLRRWLDGAEKALAAIHAHGHIGLVTGGTGLYLRALVFGVFAGPAADPALRKRLASLADEQGTAHLHELLRRNDPPSAARIHPNDRLRLIRALEVWEITGLPLSAQQTQVEPRKDLAFAMAAIRRSPDDLGARIDARVDRMMDAGFLAEVEGLLATPHGPGRTASRAVGYAQLLRHLKGEMDLGSAVAEIKKETRRLARRQMTWFRSFPAMVWIDAGPADSADTLAARIGKVFGRLFRQ
jgi:tRNA dimethylallyltransferase